MSADIRDVSDDPVAGRRAAQIVSDGGDRDLHIGGGVASRVAIGHRSRAGFECRRIGRARERRLVSIAGRLVARKGWT
jgi:hypothetical protein